MNSDSSTSSTKTNRKNKQKSRDVWKDTFGAESHLNKTESSNIVQRHLQKQMINFLVKKKRK